MIPLLDKVKAERSQIGTKPLDGRGDWAGRIDGESVNQAIQVGQAVVKGVGAKWHWQDSFYHKAGDCSGDLKSDRLKTVECDGIAARPRYND